MSEDGGTLDAGEGGPRAQQRDFVTTREAADLLHVSRSRVAQLITDGKITAYKVGTVHLIPTSALHSRIQNGSALVQSKARKSGDLLPQEHERVQQARAEEQPVPLTRACRLLLEHQINAAVKAQDRPAFAAICGVLDVLGWKTTATEDDYLKLEKVTKE